MQRNEPLPAILQKCSNNRHPLVAIGLNGLLESMIRVETLPTRLLIGVIPQSLLSMQPHPDSGQKIARYHKQAILTRTPTENEERSKFMDSMWPLF